MSPLPDRAACRPRAQHRQRPFAHALRPQQDPRRARGKAWRGAYDVHSVCSLLARKYDMIEEQLETADAAPSSFLAILWPLCSQPRAPRQQQAHRRSNHPRRSLRLRQSRLGQSRVPPRFLSAASLARAQRGSMRGYRAASASSQRSRASYTIECQRVPDCLINQPVTRLSRFFLRLRRAVLETEGPRPSQPVSNIQLETGPKSSAEFPKAGF